MTITDIIYNELNKHYNETILIKSPKESEEWNGEKYIRKDVIGTLTHIDSYTQNDGSLIIFIKVNNGWVTRQYEITNAEFEFIK